MPCLIITGHPCAGKTHVAHLVKERALKHKSIENVVLINEESACPKWTKTQCFESALAEKKTRAALKSAFDRSVGGHSSTDSTLVILDSLNYIKGFRYELHCISKASSEKHGVLWVLNHPAIIEAWNNASDRDATQKYDPALLRELMARYEPPDERNRWDKPLFKVDMSAIGRKLLSQQPSQQEADAANITGTNTADDAALDALRRSVYNMHDLEDNLNRKDDSAASGASNKFTQTQANANGGNNVTVKKTKSKPKRSAFQRIKKKKAASKPAENESSMASTDASDGATKTPLASAQDAPPSTPASGLPSASTEPSPVSKSDTKVKDDSLSPTKKEPAKSLEEQLDDILEAFLVNTRALTQGLSTRQHIPSNANALQNMDAITRKLVSAYSLAQSSHTGGKLVLSFNGKAYTLDHRRTVSLPELRRLQKQYLRWVGTHPPEDTTEEGISLSFLTYIETQM